MPNKKDIRPRLRFKDENGNDYPDWEVKKLEELVSFYPTNSLSRSQLNYIDGDIKNIHYGDIHTKFKTVFDITKSKVPYINPDVAVNKISNESFCKQGDLIIADASEDYKDIGKAIEIFNLNDEKLVGGLHTYLARDKKNMALGFKGYLMQSDNVRLQMMKMATGISVLGITKNNLSKIEVCIPCFDEQKKIADFLISIDNKIENLENELEELKAYKKGVMQGIFDSDSDGAASSEQRAASSEQRAASSEQRAATKD